MNKLEEIIANMTIAEQEHAVDLGHKYVFTLCYECETNPGVLKVLAGDDFGGTMERILCIHCVNLAAAGKLIWRRRNQGKSFGVNPRQIDIGQES